MAIAPLRQKLLLTSTQVINSGSVTWLRFLSCVSRDSGNALKVQEVQIPTSWGHIAGKLWGDENKRPILALHGWQDNAGTWDTLIPLLPQDYSVLAIDFPGHGQSSWLPRGMSYYPWDWLNTIELIKNHYKWNKISFLAHSMGSIAAMRYTVLFPESVDYYIAFENLYAENDNIEHLLNQLPKTLLKGQIEQTRLDTEPPSYPYDEVIQMMHKGTGHSVSLETAKYLVARGTKPSKKDSTKFYFCRDSRLKHILFIPEDKDVVRALAKKMVTPTLYIKGTDSKYSSDEFSLEIRNLLLQSNEKFEILYVPGTHHVHLNNPESVAPRISEFLKKYAMENCSRKKIQNRL